MPPRLRRVLLFGRNVGGHWPEDGAGDGGETVGDVGDVGDGECDGECDGIVNSNDGRVGGAIDGYKEVQEVPEQPNGPVLLGGFFFEQRRTGEW